MYCILLLFLLLSTGLLYFFSRHLTVIWLRTDAIVECNSPTAMSYTSQQDNDDKPNKNSTGRHGFVSIILVSSTFSRWQHLSGLQAGSGADTHRCDVMPKEFTGWTSSALARLWSIISAPSNCLCWQSLTKKYYTAASHQRGLEKNASEKKEPCKR